MYAFLKRVPLFEHLPEADLERICDVAEEVGLQAGEELFAEGSTGDRAYVIKEGQLDILKTSGAKEVLLAVREVGDVIGEMSLVEEAPRMASVRARTGAVLIAISQEQFEQVLERSPSAARGLLHTVMGRWRATESMLRQSEKMAQLGTLTAGLAHELNNPAAAVQRGAEQLQTADARVQETQLIVSRLGLGPEQLDALAPMVDAVRERASQPDDLDALDRSDQEAEVEDWLADHDVEDPWDVAPSLVSLGYQVDALEELGESWAEAQLPAILAWLAALHGRYSVVAEVHQGARRISELVKSLKLYAYLDQAPVQEVDVHEGLDSTLLLLRSKLKKGVTVKREYAEDLPRIQAYGSELNQVWTNLIDNAVDAMDGSGDLVVRTGHEGSWVSVEIIDSGAGIPEDVQAKIFNPFFTTKPPGKGTGLGLDISYNIVANKHRGEIKVHSRPGRTAFHIRLPVNFDDVETAPPPPPGKRPDDARLKEILETTKVIAVVGASAREEMPAFTVPRFLQNRGYRIIPVTPRYDSVLGEPSYPDLASVPDPIDVALIFRRSSAVPEIVGQAIERGVKTVWMQEGIVNDDAYETAREAGLDVVMDTCMRSTYKRLMPKPAD